MAMSRIYFGKDNPMYPQEFLSEGVCSLSGKVCDGKVYRHWPCTTEGRKHEGQSMNACWPCFHDFWGRGAE